MNVTQEKTATRLPRKRVCRICGCDNGRDEITCAECGNNIDSVRPVSTSPPNPARLTAQERARLNRFVCDVSSQNRRVGDGVGDILSFLKNAGFSTEEFLLCGREGKAEFPLVRNDVQIVNTLLCVGWYEGRLEFAYLS